MKDLRNKKFGHWRVIKPSEHKTKGTAQWICMCDCPAHTVRPVSTASLLSGRSTSCGCKTTNSKHGHYRGGVESPTHISWRSMKQRCLNRNCKDFERYGGRGIKVCDRWRNSFLAFLEEMGLRPAGTTLERIDNNGNYEAGNCKWSTSKLQAQNRRPVPLSIAQKRLAKLTVEQVRMIRANRGRFTEEQLAEKYGVTIPSIRNIERGVTWKGVQ